MDLTGKGKKSTTTIENGVNEFFHGRIKGKIEPKNATNYFYFKDCNGRLGLDFKQYWYDLLWRREKEAKKMWDY